MQGTLEDKVGASKEVQDMPLTSQKGDMSLETERKVKISIDLKNSSGKQYELSLIELR